MPSTVRSSIDPSQCRPLIRRLWYAQSAMTVYGASVQSAGKSSLPAQDAEEGRSTAPLPSRHRCGLPGARRSTCRGAWCSRSAGTIPCAWCSATAGSPRWPAPESRASRETVDRRRVRSSLARPTSLLMVAAVARRRHRKLTGAFDRCRRHDYDHCMFSRCAARTGARRRGATLHCRCGRLSAVALRAGWNAHHSDCAAR